MTRFLKKFQNVAFLVSAEKNLRINFDWASLKKIFFKVFEILLKGVFGRLTI